MACTLNSITQQSKGKKLTLYSTYGWIRIYLVKKPDTKVYMLHDPIYEILQVKTNYYMNINTKVDQWLSLAEGVEFNVKGHKKTFWAKGNILYFDCHSEHMGEYICQNIEMYVWIITLYYI